MRPAAWPERLQWLVARFSEFGIATDLAALPVAELYGLYRFLSRAVEGA